MSGSTFSPYVFGTNEVVVTKLFLWEDVSAPPLIVKEDGAVIAFYDYPDLWNFRINDQIHYKTRLGVTIFQVEKVEPANELNFPERMRKVTARKMT